MVSFRLRVPVFHWFRSKPDSLDLAGFTMMYSPDKMMGSKGLHGAPITAPGCFPSGRYSPPPYRAAPDPMPPPPRRCMPNPTVSNHHFTPSFIRNFNLQHRDVLPPRRGDRRAFDIPIKELFQKVLLRWFSDCRIISRIQIDRRKWIKVVSPDPDFSVD